MIVCVLGGAEARGMRVWMFLFLIISSSSVLDWNGAKHTCYWSELQQHTGTSSIVCHCSQNGVSLYAGHLFRSCFMSVILYFKKDWAVFSTFYHYSARLTSCQFLFWWEIHEFALLVLQWRIYDPCILNMALPSWPDWFCIKQMTLLQTAAIPPFHL